MTRKWITTDALPFYDDGSPTAAGLNAFLAAHANKTVIIPPGMIIDANSPITPPSNITIIAYGATLRNTSAGANTVLISLVGLANVLICGMTFDGLKASFVSATEFRHNVWLENSDNITLRDCYSHDAKGDGYYIGDNNVSANYNTNITLDNCRGTANHRNGLSIVAVDGMYVVGGRYSNQSGTSPQAGIDVEPNAASTICRNITIDGAVMDGNVGPAAGTAFHASNAGNQRNVNWIGCGLINSTDATVGRGASVRNPREVRFIGCYADNNAAEGCYVDDTGSSKDFLFTDGSASRNGREGIVLFNVPSTIRNNDIKDNSTAASNTRDGLDITPTSSTSGYDITGNRFDGSTQRNGVRTGSNAKKVTLIGNRYGTMGTANRSLSDEVGSRTDLDNAAGIQLSNTAAGSIVMRTRETGDTNDRWLLRSDGEQRWSDGSAATDLRLWRNAAAQLRTDGAFLLGTSLQIGTATAAGTQYIQFFEQTADPAAGSANTARLFAKDNGAGKTQIVVRFNTGATQVIATEP